jgi:hypothetical protein
MCGALVNRARRSDVRLDAAAVARRCSMRERRWSSHCWCSAGVSVAHRSEASREPNLWVTVRPRRDSVLVHPGLDPIAHRLLLVRVEVVVPVLQGFFDVVLVIAAVRMIVDLNPEIVIIPVVVVIEPVIVDIRD